MIRGTVSGTRAAPVVTLIACLTLAACNVVEDILDVQAPDLVDAGEVVQPDQAPLLLSGAIADFQCALAFYIVSGGLISDELRDTQNAAAIWDYDRRGFADGRGPYGTASCDNTGAIFGVYVPLSTARFTADDLLRRLEEDWSDEQVPDRTGMIATAAAYSGYAHVLLGEGFCSMALDGGPELQPADVFQRAEARFTRAIEAARATGDAETERMALVGRARARLNLGRVDEAAADAALVPLDFRKDAFYSTAAARSGNHVFRRVNRFGWASVGTAYRELDFSGVPDPRVPVSAAGRVTSDALHELWTQTKYPTEETAIPIATGEEALLIRAEARGGQTAVALINELHAAAGLPAFESDDPDEIRQHLIEERRRALFLEGHRVHDLLRFDVELTPPPGTPYPDKGGSYGSTVCLPLPEVERQNNPNIPS